MRKIRVVLLLLLVGLVSTFVKGQSASDSILLYIHVDPGNAILKLNDDTIPNKKWFKIAKGTYFFSCHGLNFNAAYDTLQIYSDKQTISFWYKMQVNSEFVLNESFYKAKFIGGCIALGNSTALGLRQHAILNSSYGKIEDLVFEIETHPLGHEKIPAYNDEIAYYNRQKKILIASYAGIAASSYLIYRNRVNRNKRRNEYLNQLSFNVLPYFNYDLNLCGTSIFLQF